MAKTEGAAQPITMTAPTPKPRKSALTRNAILQAARACFTHDSYDQVTLAAIACRAGANVALINRYFGSKEELFREAIVSAYHYPEPLKGLPPRAALQKLVDISCDRVPEGAVDIVLAHLRSIAVEPAGAMLRRGGEERFIAPLAEILPGDQATLRAELINALLFGIRTQRDIVGATELNRLSGEALAQWITPLVLHLSGLAEADDAAG